MRDLDGFERFCLDAHPRLVAALGHQVGDPGLAEELAQEALIRAGVRWAQVGRLDAPIGWAFRVGANLASSHFRRRQAERRALSRLDADTPREPDAADAVTVRAALLTLTSQQREVVVLRYYLGLSAEEAARLLGVNAGAVRGLTHRALNRLRQVIDVPARAEEATDVP